jgi:hypothetical protein
MSFLSDEVDVAMFVVEVVGGHEERKSDCGNIVRPTRCIAGTVYC